MPAAFNHALLFPRIESACTARTSTPGGEWGDDSPTLNRQRPSARRANRGRLPVLTSTRGIESIGVKGPSLARVPNRLTGSLARAQPRWSPWTLAFSNTYRRQARRGQALTIRRTEGPERIRVGCHPSRNKVHRCLRQTRDPDIPLSLREGIRCTARHQHRRPRVHTRTCRDCQACRRPYRNRTTSPQGWLTWGFSRLRTAKFPYVFLSFWGVYDLLTVCLASAYRLRTHLRRKPSFLRAENAPHARIMTKASARPHSQRLLGRTCPQVNPRTSRPSSSPSRPSRRRRTA